MVTPLSKPRLSPALERRLAQHRIEVERLRRGLGDPAEALSAFVREHYDQAALSLAFQEMCDGRGLWTDDRAEPRLDG